MEEEKTRVIYEVREFDKKSIPFTMHGDSITPKTQIPTMNRHRDLELFLITEGEGMVTSDLHTIKCREGDLVVVNPGHIHRICTENSVTYICMVVDYNLLKKFTDDPKSVVFCEKINDLKINRLIKEINLEYELDLPYRTDILSYDTEKVLALLFRSYIFNGIDETGDRKMLPKIKKAIDYMESNLGKHIGLTEISDAAGLTRYHFCREFSKITGQSPIEFLNSVRCERAKSMLVTGKYTVSDVSDACGFSSPSYFSKVFRRKCEMSPGEFISPKNKKRHI